MWSLQKEKNQYLVVKEQEATDLDFPEKFLNDFNAKVYEKLRMNG